MSALIDEYQSAPLSDQDRAMLAYEKALGSEQTTLVLSPNSEFFRHFGDLTGNARGRTMRDRTAAPT